MLRKSGVKKGREGPLLPHASTCRHCILASPTAGRDPGRTHQRRQARQSGRKCTLVFSKGKHEQPTDTIPYFPEPKESQTRSEGKNVCWAKETISTGERDENREICVNLIRTWFHKLNWLICVLSCGVCLAKIRIFERLSPNVPDDDTLW